MSTQAFNGAYLLPLFSEIEQARADGAYRPLPAPAPASSLATDDAPLGVYAAAHLIRASYTAGLAHADTLRRLTVAGEVDPTSPWTLLPRSPHPGPTRFCSPPPLRPASPRSRCAPPGGRPPGSRTAATGPTCALPSPARPYRETTASTP
ncbi:hypothetical protein [Streptomyces sp. NPDC057336]|uniref:hypothetical protein n=1 Tax=Streptomyces sp. NPDC057336 TaxID=3346102 RepID=UPI00363127C6